MRTCVRGCGGPRPRLRPHGLKCLRSRLWVLGGPGWWWWRLVGESGISIGRRSGARRSRRPAGGIWTIPLRRRGEVPASICPWISPHVGCARGAARTMGIIFAPLLRAGENLMGGLNSLKLCVHLGFASGITIRVIFEGLRSKLANSVRS